MVRINLLPVREIKRRIKAKQQILAFIIGLVCLLIVLGITGFQQAKQHDGLKQKLVRIQQQKQKYTKVIREIRQLEKDKSRLETQINIIHNLKAESSLTVHILDEIANQTPSRRMWLTSLTQTGNKLTVTGFALDNRTIAKYMEDLKKSIYIQNVSLASSSLAAFAGRNLKSFSLSCAIGIPAEEKEPKKKITTS